MTVDENEVRNIVVITLAKHKAGGCCDQVCAAWQELYDLRNLSTPAYDPVAVAIAEHYLYARCKVCSAEYSQGQMRSMVKGYDLAKRAGLSEYLKSNPNNPTSPPTDEAVIWGLRGADEGELDRMRCNAKAAPPTFVIPAFFKNKKVYGK